jgi:Protein of unknown function (DUF1569)
MAAIYYKAPSKKKFSTFRKAVLSKIKIIMKSLLNQIDNKEIVSRINKLTANTKRLWGKMTVAQMLAHAQNPLCVAFGEKKLKRGFLGILFGKMAKKRMTGDAPFKKNMPTDKSFLVKEEKKFDEEKNKLIRLVLRFVTEGEAGISENPHPFFGKLTTNEWDILQWKHLDHHLRQFGV